MFKSLFSTSHRFVGLDIHDTEIRLIQLQIKNKKPYIQEVGWASLPLYTLSEGHILNTSALLEKLRELVFQTRSKGLPTAIALPRNQVITHDIQLPEPLTRKECEIEMKMHLSRYLPMIKDPLCFDFLTFTPRQITLIATRETQLQTYVQLCEESQLNLQIVDVDLFVLDRNPSHTLLQTKSASHILPDYLSENTTRLALAFGLALRGITHGND